MMGFNPTFYAGRPKLSEVTIDSDLNLGTHSIKTNTIETDVIKTDVITTDVINEKTAGNGVIVDGVVCKDGVAVIGL